MNLYYILEKASAFSVIIPIAVSIIRFKKLSAALIIFAFFLFVSLLFELFNNYLAEAGINNLWLMNIYTLVEYFFLCAVFFLAMKIKKLRWIVLVLAVGFTFFISYRLSLPGDGEKFAIWSMAGEALLMLLVVCLYFLDIYLQTKVFVLTRYPMFWISAGVMIYFTPNFLLFVLSNYVLKQPGTDLRADWSIHSVSNLLANACYTVGLWLSRMG